MAVNHTSFFQHLFHGEDLKSIASAVEIEMLSYLDRCATPPHPALPWKTPEQVREAMQGLILSLPRNDLATASGRLAQAYLSFNNHLHSPHYMGHQVPPPIPAVAPFQAMAGLSNQGVGVFEMGPFAVAAERHMISELGRYLNWTEGEFDAIVTHGGSLANLTALLAARNLHIPNSWSEGITPSTKGRPAILTSADSHYSISRAAAMIGIGAEQVIKVPLNSKRQMETSHLPALLAQARSNGLHVFCIVGSACSTPVGAFDDLDEIAQFAQRNEIWFHVDGAHGAPLLLSSEHRAKVRGIERADSVTWDAHKMMFVPSLCTFLFYRNKRHSYAPFQQDAPYLFQNDEDLNSYDCALRTVECTKGALIVPIWAMWILYGADTFAKLVDRTLAQTRSFYQWLQTLSDFEALHEPECNILCFRYRPSSNLTPQELSQLQQKLRGELLQSGDFYITGTRLDGDYVLRVTIINPLTELSHFSALIEKIRLLGGHSSSQGSV